MKQSLLNKASLYCEIKDLGNGQYKITKVFTEPKPAVLSKMQSGLYQYMSPLILIKLLKEHDENNKATFPLLDWALYIEMINKNYAPMKYNQETASEYLDINIEIINEFFEKMDDSMRYYIENCLEYLRKADVLVWYKVPMVRKRNIKRVELDNSDIGLACSYIDGRATDEEIKYIISCSELIRTKLGIKNKSECFYGGRAEIYRTELNKLLRQRDILYFYDSYEVYYTNLDRCNNLLEEFSYKNENDLVKKFNSEFINNIVTNAQKRHDKDIAEEIVKQYRLEETYVANFKVLSDLTVDKKQKKNIYKLMKIKSSKKYKISNDFHIVLFNDKGEKINELK
jgi:hypothetical protein